MEREIRRQEVQKGERQEWKRPWPTDGEGCGAWFCHTGASVSPSITEGWRLSALSPQVRSQAHAPRTCQPQSAGQASAPTPPAQPTRQGPVSSGRRGAYFDTAAPDACDNILARNVTWQVLLHRGLGQRLPHPAVPKHRDRWAWASGTRRAEV